MIERSREPAALPCSLRDDVTSPERDAYLRHAGRVRLHVLAAPEGHARPGSSSRRADRSRLEAGAQEVAARLVAHPGRPATLVAPRINEDRGAGIDGTRIFEPHRAWDGADV